MTVLNPAYGTVKFSVCFSLMLIELSWRSSASFAWRV
jgi:hypothetical protein